MWGRKRKAFHSIGKTFCLFALSALLFSDGGKIWSGYFLVIVFVVVAFPRLVNVLSYEPSDKLFTNL